MGRKLHFVLGAILALVVLVFGFGDIAEAKAHRSVRFDSVSLRNMGELSQELRVEFFDVRRGGRIARHPGQKFTIGLAGGSSFRWERLRIGKVYLVKVTRITTDADELVLVVPYVAVRGVEGRVIEIPGEAAPIDPRDEQIAALQAQIAALELLMSAKNADIEALLAQIGSLQKRIDDLVRAQVSGPTLTVAISTATPPAKIAVMGASSIPILTVRFSANNFDSLRTAGVVLKNKVTGGRSGLASFMGITAWNGAAQVAGPTDLVMTSDSEGAATLLLSNLVTPKNGSIDLTFKADVASWNSGGAVSGSAHQFRVEASSLEVLTVGSPSTWATVVGSAVGNSMTVARTNLTLSTTSSGSTSHARTVMDALGTVIATADSSYQALLESLKVMFSGSAATYQGGAQTLLFVDTATGFGLQVNSQWDEVRGAWVATMPLGYLVSAGVSKTWLVRTNSSNFPDAPGVTESLTVTVIGGSWSDGTTTFDLDSAILPLALANVSY